MVAPDGIDDVTRECLGRLVVEGEKVRGMPVGPQQPESLVWFREAYLGWHDALLRVLHSLPGRVAEEYETTRWQLVVGDRVSDDQLARTVYGDVEAKLARLRQLLERAGPPLRAVPDPAGVGVAVYDANCLFSKHGRYLLLGFAVHGVVLARWSRRVLEETAANLAGHLRGDSLEDLGRWLKVEIDLVRDGLVEGYERWVGEITLPDPGDTHVLAAAIEAGATTIVTANLRHFPDEALAPFGIVAMGPDEFAMACIDANPVLAARIVTDHPDPEMFLDRLTASLPQAARRLRALIM